MRNAIAVVVEGMGTSLIGAYGSNTAVTPAIDRLAAHGLVLDQCFVDSTDLASQLSSLWTGRHAMQSGPARWSIWQQLTERRHPASLFTDCPKTAELAEQLGCEAVTLVTPPARDAPAADSADCSIMTVFAAAAEELADGLEGLVWIHSQGLRLPWDAPLSLRCRFVDPEDPDPPADAVVPQFEVTSETDPDSVVGWGQVAAAQVAVVDLAIDALRVATESRARAETWSWLVASLGGVPLGEHGRVGWGHPQLYGEEVSAVATFCRSPRSPTGQRRAELCQLPDLAITLLDCMGLLDGEFDPAGRIWGRSMLGLGPIDHPSRWDRCHKLAMIEGPQPFWIRSPAWSASLGAAVSPELYVKPDDRWEVTNVADRRFDIVKRLESVAADFRQAIADNRRSNLPDLEEELCNLLR